VFNESGGNGPQVGMLALESENDPALSRPYPLDDLVAQTQGMIGYWLAQSLYNAGVPKSILSNVTQTEVDPTDPSFSAPTKFVGSGYPREQAAALAAEHDWRIAEDGQRSHRTPGQHRRAHRHRSPARRHCRHHDDSPSPTGLNETPVRRGIRRPQKSRR
jgi:carbamate kinase